MVRKPHMAPCHSRLWIRLFLRLFCCPPVPLTRQHTVATRFSHSLHQDPALWEHRSQAACLFYPHGFPKPGWSISPLQAPPSPHSQAPHLRTAAYRAIGRTACDTPVQTLTHRAGAPTPAFPNMVCEAPLFTALTRLCLAPGMEIW